MGARSDWTDELDRWLQPFLECLGHKALRWMCLLYVAGLIGPGVTLPPIFIQLWLESGVLSCPDGR